jgi:hypothetical protein
MRSTESRAEAPGGRDARVCPKLGYVDNPPEHYSHPTHLHRCYASVGPTRLSTQQQRDLCLTEGHLSCPRLAGVYEPRVRTSVVAPQPVRPAPAAALAQQGAPESIANDQPYGRAPFPHPRVEDADWLAPAADVASVQRQPERISVSSVGRRRYVARAGVAVGGFVIGVGLAAIALMALFGGNPLQDDELARLEARVAAARPSAALRIPAEFVATSEPAAPDPGQSTAGIQQPAPSAETEPTAAPAPTQLPAPTAAPQVRLAPSARRLASAAQTYAKRLPQRHVASASSQTVPRWRSSRAPRPATASSGRGSAPGTAQPGGS